MQNLYMMATLIRTQEMQKMAIEINAGLLNIEQAMVRYNVSTKEAVLTQIENLKSVNKRPAASRQRESIDLNAQAA